MGVLCWSSYENTRCRGARLAQIKRLTAVNDPYEEPINPEICSTLTSGCSPEDITRKVTTQLVDSELLLDAADEKIYGPVGDRAGIRNKLTGHSDTWPRKWMLFKIWRDPQSALL